MITHHNALDASNIAFSELRKNAKGGKVVYLSGGKGKEKITVQFPKLRAPFGLSEFVDQNSGNSSYSLDLSLENKPELLAKLQAIDDAVVKQVASNSKDWLGKKHTETVIRDVLYRPLVKQPNDDKYAPTIKLKILKDRDGTFVPECYNNKKQRVDLDTLEKGQSVTAIATIPQMWIIDGKFGVTMRLHMARFSPTNKLTGYSFLPDDDDDEVEAEAEASSEEAEGEEEFEGDEDDIVDDC
jgi:hypothetical protein